MGGVFQMLFGTDAAAMCGAALGGVGGFWLAKGFSQGSQPAKCGRLLFSA